MDRDTTLVILAVAAAITFAGLLGDRARARAPLAAHALLPWHALIFAGLLTAILAVAHLLSLRTPPG